MTSTVEEGQWMAIALHDRSVCPVGRVQAVDTYGVRLTSLDWQSGEIGGLDAVVPWSAIAHMLAAPAEHDRQTFLAAARAFAGQYGPGVPSLEADELTGDDASTETGPPLLATIPPEFYELHVRELGLSPNVYKWLVRGNLSQIGWLAECSDSDLLRYPKIGRKHVAEIREKLLAFAARTHN